MAQRPAERYIRVCRQRAAPDWDHAPLPFKLYSNCPIIPLSSETLEALSQDHDHHPTHSLGLLLHDIYGIVRVAHYANDIQDAAQNSSLSAMRRYRLSLGRTVASGGARYPGELYLLVGPGQALASGAYHYDPAHHALAHLRSGDLTHLLMDGLAVPPKSRPGYTIMLSSLFWKNACKYQEFSYRLQGLDIGCLLAQVQMVAERCGLKPALHFRFLDHPVNHLLGLHSMEEGVYAIITLGTAETASLEVVPQPPRDTAQGAAEPYLGDEPSETLEQYEALSRWPLLEAIHRESHIQARTDLGTSGAITPLALPATADLAFELPAMKHKHARVDAGSRRSSWPVQFRPRPLTLEQLALVLQSGQRGYRGDLDGEVPMLVHTLLYCVINHVEGIPPGIYAYDAPQHLLRQIRAGEFHQALQATQAGLLVNAANLSLCVIPVGNYMSGFRAYGDRWYRIQNMEAGMIAQRMYLAAAATGLGCRASLSYRDEAADALLGLPEGYTSLLQVLISPLDSAAQEYGRHDVPITW